MNTYPSRGLLVSFVVGALLLSAASCGRDTLIGIDTIDPAHPGPPLGSGGSSVGSGGVMGAGDGSGGTSCGTPGGASGAPGSGGAPSCATISTAPGQRNDCGHTMAVEYSPDGTLLATVTENSSTYLHVWRLSDGALMYERSDTQNPQGALGVAFSPDGKLIATAGYGPTTVSNGITTHWDTNTVVIWDTATGARLTTLPTNCGGYASSVAFSPDGTRLATAGFNRGIEFWNVADWTQTLAIPDTTLSYYGLHFSPDGTRILASGGGGDTIYDAANGQQLAQVLGIVSEMNEASYSPDGQLIFAIAGEGQIQILDKNAMTLQLMTFTTVTTPAPYIGHGRWIGNDHVVADDWPGTVEEWSKDPGQSQGPFSLTRTWSMPGQALGMAVAPDGHAFVVAGDFGFTFLTP